MSTDFCFYHAADLHLDTPFSGVERAAPAIARALQDASLDAFDALVDRVIADRAAFLVLAGDIYDGAERGVRAQLRFLSGLQRLAAAGIPAFVVHGNHDPLDGWSAIQRWPEGVHVFGADAVQTVPIMRDGERLATVHGISYASARTEANLARQFRRGPEPGLHVGLLHCNVDGNADHAAYAPCTLDDLRAAQLDYWALGHIHQRQVLARTPWVVYPGNTQGRSPKPSEGGPKGAFRVEVRGGVVTEPAFVALDAIRFVEVPVDVGAVPDVGALRGLLTAVGEDVAAAHAGRALILRIRLVGRPAWYADLGRADVLPALLASLREEGEARKPFIWWERLESGLRAPLERAAIRAGGDFSAAVIEEHDRLLTDPEVLAAWAAGLDRSLARLGAVPPASDLQAILAEAERLALDALRI